MHIHEFYQQIYHIKIHDSELRGQEEAVTTE